MDNSEWTEVARPKKVRNHSSCEKTPSHISFEQLATVLTEQLSPYQRIVAGVFVYGSRARGNNKPTSDADVLVFWTRRMNLEELCEIRSSIEARLEIPVDLVSCILTQNEHEIEDARDQAYFDNVLLDARHIMGRERFLVDLVNRCVKLPKLRR
jgi:predicted nucleotidyltransferase